MKVLKKADKIDISDVDYTQNKEPDIYDLNTPKSINGPSYNPFSENVIEKEYRTPQVATAESIPDIIEPSFQKPTYDDLIASNEETAPDDSQPKEGFDAFAQSDTETSTKSENESNADGLVDVCFVAYGVLNNLGGKAWLVYPIVNYLSTNPRGYLIGIWKSLLMGIPLMQQ